MTKINTNTIASISADGQERLDTVRSSEVARVIKMLKQKGYLNIKVIS